MRVYKVIMLMGLLGLVTASPAMAWDFGISFGHDFYYAPPMVVERPYYYYPYDTVVYEDEVPLVVERPYYPVYHRYDVGFNYFGGSRYYDGGHRYYSGGHSSYRDGGGHRSRHH